MSADDNGWTNRCSRPVFMCWETNECVWLSTLQINKTRRAHWWRQSRLWARTIKACSVLKWGDGDEWCLWQLRWFTKPRKAGRWLMFPIFVELPHSDFPHSPTGGMKCLPLLNMRWQLEGVLIWKPQYICNIEITSANKAIWNKPGQASNNLMLIWVWSWSFEFELKLSWCWSV